MAKARKDHRGRALRKGEIQRKDMSYIYPVFLRKTPMCHETQDLSFAI